MTDEKTLIELRDGVRILTRAGYAKAIDTYYPDAIAEVLGALVKTEPQRFRQLAIQRFDIAAPKYGPLDLDGRDWVHEGNEEDLDAIAYRVIRRVRDFGL